MRRGAFTLLELLIVIAIVAILAGAMIPMFNVNRETARQAKATAEADVIKTASMMMHHDTGSWPPASNTGTDFITDDSSFAGWNGPYLDAWQNDPWGTAYDVYDPAATTERRVRSRGADLAVGGGDDIDIIITPDDTQ